MARTSKKSAMITPSLSRLPAQAGSALAGALGRGALWALDRFSRAPLASLAVIGMTACSTLAVSNALFFQDRQHPAPLFNTTSEAQTAEVSPSPEIVPFQRSAPLVIDPVRSLSGQPDSPAEVSPVSTASVPDLPDEPIGNAEVFEVQKKLLAMNLFEGTVDGYYGPKTAQAIKAFEAAHGMEPLGALTPEVVAAILAAPLDEAMAGNTQVTAMVAQTPPGVQPMPEALAEASDPIAAIASAAGETLPARPPEDALALMPAPVQATTLPRTAEVVELEVPVEEPVSQPLPAGVDQAMIQTVPNTVSTNAELVAAVQRGLASLGFLYGQVDGVAGEGTAKAIRNFEVYYNYEVTGEVTPELVRMLRQAGAAI